MAMENVSLYAVGDVAAFYKDHESMFAHTGSILNEADITFGQNERHYTNRYSEEHDLMPGVPFSEISPLEHAAALKRGGFDVMSFASNHCMDLGPGAMLETIAALRDNGFAVVGAGKNIEEARKPVILERKGTKIAFLAYAAVIRPGWEAGADRPGCAPMRAQTFYQQIDYQPGTPPAIITYAYREDLKAMREDIEKVRPFVDIVVVSFHWGIHFIPAVLAMYQREVAHEAIDAGVDLILGHHPHILKGIEIYRGKAIFYSMGNFAFDVPLAERMRREAVKVEKSLYPIKVDPEYAEWFAWPAECRKSMIVKCSISGKKIKKLSFLPVLINTKAQPVVVSGDDAVREALENMRDISSSQGLNTEFHTEEGEIVIAT